MVWHLDEPYGGGLPSWYVFQFMSGSVTVGLTGTGGDEAFGNYGKYRALEGAGLARWMFQNRAGFDLLGKGLRGLEEPYFRLIQGLPNGKWGQALKRHALGLFDFGHGPLGRYYFNPYYYFSDVAKRAGIFQNGGGETQKTALLLESCFKRSGTKDIRDSLAYLDFKTQLPDEFLMMTDRLSMAHSLEARVPFLDHEFVEMVFRIRSSMRTQPNHWKYLLKKAVGDLLPADVLAARKKGFVIPVKLWLRGRLKPLAKILLDPKRLERQGIFRPSFYFYYVKPHLDGRADYTTQVWSMLMFQLWHCVFIERKASQVPSYGLREIVRG